MNKDTSKLKNLMKKNRGELYIANRLDGIFYPIYNIGLLLKDIHVETLTYHENLILRAAGETKRDRCFDDDDLCKC